jgi:putative nucleotidyltransferase with HDIG domain
MRHPPPEQAMTSRTEAPRHPALFRGYYTLVVLAAAALLARYTPGAEPQSPLVVGLVLVLMLLADAQPISLPSGGYATASGLFDLPSLVVLGPVYTSWLSVASTLVNEGLVQRRPAIRVVHNLAIFTLTYFAAAWGFRLAGGTVGSLAFPRDIPALLTCGAAYFVANSALVSTVLGLTSGPSPWRVWQSNFMRGILHHLSFIALGSLVVVVYFSVGPWALVLFGIPFLVARHSFGLYMEIKSDLKEFVRALTEVLEEIDPYTRHHSVRVSQYAVRLARGMKLPEREVEEIEYAALVHDLGKIGPQHQHILQKPGSLSQEEQRTLRAHPAAGADIVSRVRALRRAAEIVRSHHERPDGLGYPFGLKSEDVPIGARILNVSDAFDAMTSDRPYRRALSLDAALEELKRGAGTQFDAGVVGCLVRLYQAGRFPLLPSPSSEDLLLLRIKPLRARG